MKNNIIEEKEEYEAIGLRGFDYKLSEEEESVGVRDGLDGYPPLNHAIQLWSGDWENQMAKMNAMVGMKNCLLISVGKEMVTVRSSFYKAII